MIISTLLRKGHLQRVARLCLGGAMRVALVCILAMACTGCPQKMVSRKVMLAGFAGEAQQSGTVTVTDPEVQTALKIIDQVLASEGFAPTTNANFYVPDSLATYVKYSPDGMVNVLGPSVALEDERLVIRIADRGGLSTESKQVLKAIKTELRKEYGSDRVKAGR